MVSDVWIDARLSIVLEWQSAGIFKCNIQYTPKLGVTWGQARVWWGRKRTRPEVGQCVVSGDGLTKGSELAPLNIDTERMSNIAWQHVMEVACHFQPASFIE